VLVRDHPVLLPQQRVLRDQHRLGAGIVAAGEHHGSADKAAVPRGATTTHASCYADEEPGRGIVGAAYISRAVYQLLGRRPGDATIQRRVRCQIGN
jgi:hypothetical protein